MMNGPTPLPTTLWTAGPDERGVSEAHLDTLKKEMQP